MSCTGDHVVAREFCSGTARDNLLSSLVMVRDTLRLDLGAACRPVSLVTRGLAAGTLVSWGDVPGSDIALWALYPSRRLLNVRVSAFLDHLKDAFPRGKPQELAAYIEPEQ